MKGEFVRVVTSDRLELQGLFVVPEGHVGDASLLHVHGLAGNFYENRFIDYVSDAVTARSMNFLTVNTRGHDYISDFLFERQDGVTEYKQIGGIHEIFQESAVDIAAWIGFLKSRGSRRIILQGHSHGALKVTHYIHKVNDPAITGMILLSPSDDFGCQRAQIGERFDEALEVARAMIDAGKGRDLMPAGYFHYPVSANTYVGIFNPNSEFRMFNISKTEGGVLPEIESIKVPVLAIVGSVDEFFLGSPAAYLSGLKANLKNAASFTGAVVDGSPHNYLDFEAAVAKHIGEWLLSAVTGG